ncbi:MULTISPECIES: hypothetical protein [unclassified Halomonas]|uniref:hypothetical protein n=1 Tax=unclassified Halomonas TaxID=2609666 RepID=UPI0021E39A34|nr:MULTISPECIES: hypothetical protein [unclassified Halomonas]UYG01445.1 hypothetical protein OCT39_07835 [Halomonas sp. GD1P12]WNL37498.1 hypothetical protein RN346_09195 [Halomonas sp. PAMB 3232]WNL40811.1 hypothetical protein RN347_09145 [Halomonas sp. PAMB 3264]
MFQRCTFLSASLMAAVLAGISGCTTYTWPDGSQETVIGVVPEDENQRFEEQRAEGARYRVPGVASEPPQ